MAVPLLSTPKCLNSKRSSTNFNVPATPFLQKIGYGTGVSVYHLERVKNGIQNSPWALKKVNRKFANGDFADRLKKEAQLLKSFNHPNIVGFRGFKTTDDGREVLAMEECTISLGDLIEDKMENDKTPFLAVKITKVAICIAKALHYLHIEKRLIHGDVKSHNVLIKGDFEEIKLCDFGVCVPLDDSGVGPVEDYVGTLCWSAPETLVDGPLTAKADIFSFGLLLWEMIAITPPNVPNNWSDTSLNASLDLSAYENLYGKCPPLPDIPLGPEYSKIVDIFHLCTENDYEKRPSAEEILKLLQ